MYYYLDKEDGYSKGPYSWEELKRLPLLPDTYIFDKPNRRWRTFYRHQSQMAAEATQEVNRKARRKTAVPVPDQRTAPETSRPIYQPMPPAFPDTSLPDLRLPRPGSLQLPGTGGAPAMGLSGTGCFVAAVLFALLVVGFIVWVGN